MVPKIMFSRRFLNVSQAELNYSITLFDGKLDKHIWKGDFERTLLENDQSNKKKTQDRKFSEQQFFSNFPYTSNYSRNTII